MKASTRRWNYQLSDADACCTCKKKKEGRIYPNAQVTGGHVIPNGWAAHANSHLGNANVAMRLALVIATQDSSR